MNRTVKVVLVMLILLTSCSNKSSPDQYRVSDYRIYMNTPVWELAQAVKNNNAKRISDIASQHPEWLDYQDPVYGTTLLFWAVATERFIAAEALLKAGADPDIISTYEGGTALYRAAGYSLVDKSFKKDPKYVKLLLSYGADPNIGFVGNDHNNSTDIGTTPLMNSIYCGIEKTKALVEGGADINYATPEHGRTAAIEALGAGGYTNSTDQMAYAYYLIVEKKAIITEPYNARYSDLIHQPVDALRYWMPELGSDAYRMKMEIVDEFARQGVDYWVTEVLNSQLETIKKRFPKTWEEYLEKY